MRAAIILLLAASAALTLACTKASMLREEQPVSAGLAKYPSASVESKLEPDAEKVAAGFDGRLTERVIDQLKTKNVFTKVDKAAAGAGDLGIKMTIVKADKGSSIGLGTQGDASVDIVIDLFDTKDSKPLGKFTVHSDSSRSSSLRVSGVDTTTGSNPLNRAVDSAAEEIGTYLAGKK